MEDILASIRKIIAEDPPGSRPSPTPAPRAASTFAAPVQSQANSPFAKAPVRDPIFEQQPVAEAPAVVAEPYLRASPAKPDLSAFTPAPFFPKASEPAQPVQRVEPSFAAMSAPVVEPIAVAAPVSEPVNPAQSVDAQLSDLLGEVSPSAPSHVNELSPADIKPTTPAADFAAEIMGRTSTFPVADAAPAAEARHGFTVSRDGYLSSKPAQEGARDPFDFDLGPSPFNSKAQTQGATSFDLGGVVPSRSSQSENARAPVVEPSAAPQAPEAAPRVSFAMPSIAATLAPASPAPSVQAAPEPIAAELNALETAAPQPVASEPDVIDAVVHETADDQMSTREAASTPSNPMVVAERADDAHAMAAADTGQRTMEDTVADLLRPMLKTWLAENMPRIVERALRRELTDQIHPEHKTAAE
ncbi:MAG: DUF2497 domain-containing protein [Hyphomicrobium sp.]